MMDQQQRNNYIQAGRYCLSQRNFKTALQYFSKSITIDPDHLNTNILIAFTHYKLNNYDDLFESYEQCKGLYSKLKQRENILEKSIRLPKHTCEALFRNLVKQDKQIYNHFLSKGLKYLEQSKLEQSISECQKCLEINPAEFRAYFYIGHCLTLLCKYQEAIDLFQKCLRYQQNNSECYLILGVLFNRIGQKSKSSKYTKMGEKMAEIFEKQRRVFIIKKSQVLALYQYSLKKKFKYIDFNEEIRQFL